MKTKIVKLIPKIIAVMCEVTGMHHQIKNVERCNSENHLLSLEIESVFFTEICFDIYLNADNSLYCCCDIFCNKDNYRVSLKINEALKTQSLN